MTGHFEQGKWVEEPLPEEQEAPQTDQEEAESQTAAPSVDELVSGASQSVKRAINDVVVLGKHLFGTKEGRDHIEKKARAAGAELEKAINEIADSAKETIKKK
ncbi:hypothetical protein [Methanofollis fontis]|uniref:Uncharacterized protein n=1 Tax=Methanofollis fontis TaxID=2052832 RepID=A0A483CV82_9EURY|nr:hypothetical protein [Methanofollis fontis]TAJ43255.1 hypothetical protein CUJ86_11475 [Methanofollis fontis]